MDNLTNKDVVNEESKEVILDIQATSEKIHYAKDSQKSNYRDLSKSHNKENKEMLSLCKEVNENIQDSNINTEMEDLSDIRAAIKSTPSKTSITNKGQLGKVYTNNIVNNFLQKQEKEIESSGLSRHYLESIGLKQARWHNSKIIKRGKNFLLNLNRDSNSKRIDDIRMKLLFGAFGIKKGIKVRFAL